jgi:hypothetical protein
MGVHHGVATSTPYEALRGVYSERSERAQGDIESVSQVSLYE